jgi:hypothetical protein
MMHSSCLVLIQEILDRTTLPKRIQQLQRENMKTHYDLMTYRITQSLHCNNIEAEFEL